MTMEVTSTFRKGLRIRLKNTLMDVTDSLVRVWHTREGVPYKYEFRGEKYQGYLNPEDVVVD